MTVYRSSAVLPTDPGALTADERAGMPADINVDNPLVSRDARDTWWAEQPPFEITAQDVLTVQRAQTVESIGEGTALTLPAYSGTFQALITGTAAIAITPPASGEIEQRLTVYAGVVARCGATIDVQNAHLDVAITASTSPRTIVVYIGGEDADVTLASVLGDASASLAALDLSFVGQEERPVVFTFASGAASTLTLTLTMASATGSAYLSAITLVGPSGTARDPILTRSLPQWTPGRVYLTREGHQDWALFGRTAGDSTDEKPTATDIGALSVTGDTRTQVTSLAEYVFEDAAPADAYQATLSGANLYWTGDGAVGLIPAGAHAMAGLVVRSDRTATVRASISVRPVSATDAPAAQTIQITSDPADPFPSVGQTVTYTGTILDQYGAAVAGTVVWSAPDGGGSITQAGVFTAAAAGGPYRIVAEYGVILSTVYVSVADVSQPGLLGYIVSTPTFEPAVDLTALGDLDWVHFGLTDNTSVNGKSGVDLLSGLTQLGGTWVQGRWESTLEGFSWTGGAPTASATDVPGYFDVPWAERLAGRGWSFTAPADTTQRTLMVWLGAYLTTGTLTATLSDSSAAPITWQFTPTTSTRRMVAISYSAAAAGQTLTVTWTQESADGNVAINAVALAAGDAEAVLTTVTVTPATVTVVEGQSVSFVVDALDQFSRRMEGTVIDVAVSGGGTLDVADADAGATVVFTAATDGVGERTLTASVGAIQGTATITVEDYVAPTGLPEVDLGQTTYDAAMTASLTLDGDNRPATPWCDLTLALIAVLDPSATRRTNATARLVQRIQAYLGADIVYGKPTGVANWVSCIRLQAYAIVRNTPALWAALTVDQKDRMDWYVYMHAYCANMYANPAHNNGRNAINWVSLSVFSTTVVPNQRIAPYELMGCILYLGSLAAFNAVTAAWNKTTMLAKLQALGWSTIYTTWSKTSRLAALEFGTTITVASGATMTYSSNGVKEPIANIVLGYLSNPFVGDGTALFDGITDPGPALAATPMNIYTRGVDQLCINRECKDLIDCSTSTDTNTCIDRYGHPKPGYTTRHLGEAVMCGEFNYNNKSAIVYASPVMSFCGALVTGLRVLGQWPTGTNEALMTRWRKAADAMADRAVSAWWDPHNSRCAYEARLGDSPTSYDGGNFWHACKREIWDNTTLVWP